MSLELVSICNDYEIFMKKLSVENIEGQCGSNINIGSTGSNIYIGGSLYNPLGPTGATGSTGLTGPTGPNAQTSQQVFLQSQVLLNSGSSFILQSGVDTNEFHGSFKCSQACTVSKLYCQTEFATDTNWTITVRVNSINTVLSATILNASNQGSNLVNSFPCGAGDNLSVLVNFVGDQRVINVGFTLTY